MSIYLDTHVVVWLCEARTEKLTPKAVEAIESSEVEISPMVLLELEYLFEIKRIVRPAMALLDQLERQIGLKLSDFSFAAAGRIAVLETWTRDPFDRMIVAQARADDYKRLVSSDAKILENYSRTIWL